MMSKGDREMAALRSLVRKATHTTPMPRATMAKPIEWLLDNGFSVRILPDPLGLVAMAARRPGEKYDLRRFIGARKNEPRHVMQSLWRQIAESAAERTGSRAPDQ